MRANFAELAIEMEAKQSKRKDESSFCLFIHLLRVERMKDQWIHLSVLYRFKWELLRTLSCVSVALQSFSFLAGAHSTSLVQSSLAR